MIIIIEMAHNIDMRPCEHRIAFANFSLAGLVCISYRVVLTDNVVIDNTIAVFNSFTNAFLTLGGVSNI